MKTWTKVATPIAGVAVLGAWYAFRPERLVVNRQVDETMPTAQSGSSPQSLESGQFYSILHPTQGTATIYQGRKEITAPVLGWVEDRVIRSDNPDVGVGEPF